MKRLNFIAVTILLMLIPTLYSCMEGGYSNEMDNFPEDTRVAIVTICQKATESPSKFYLKLDDGKTIYPTTHIGIGNPTIKNGQRAFAYLKLIDNTAPEADAEYDYNAELFKLVDILTKDIIPMTEETADSIGDDRINIANPWIAEGYLTMEFQYYGTQNISKKHMLNLVHNQANDIIDTEGYISLEFRHNAFKDPQSMPEEGFVSFKLDNVNEEMKTAKGLKIRVNTIYDGIQFFKIDFEAKSGDSRAPTTEQLRSMLDAIQTNY